MKMKLLNICLYMLFFMGENTIMFASDYQHEYFLEYKMVRTKEIRSLLGMSEDKFINSSDDVYVLGYIEKKTPRNSIVEITFSCPQDKALRSMPNKIGWIEGNSVNKKFFLIYIGKKELQRLNEIQLRYSIKELMVK